jgi:hypothetical protein
MDHPGAMENDEISEDFDIQIECFIIDLTNSMK